MFSLTTIMKIICAKNLKKCSNNNIVKVAGLVILKQRPSTANGVTFIYLEDETGIVNIICWKDICNRYHKEIILSKLLIVIGRVQCENGTVNVIAKSIYDASSTLDLLPQIK